jgi:hypothetical protein
MIAGFDPAILDGFWRLDANRFERDLSRITGYDFSGPCSRNSEGLQQNRANKNKRGAYGHHVELHRDVHASHLHHCFAEPNLSESRE